MAYVPDRGHWVWIQFNPQAGHEQAGMRPGLVLSPIAFNRASGLCFVAPVTNTRRGFATQVVIPKTEPVSGVVLADHARSLDYKARAVKFIGVASSDVLEDVVAIVTSILDPE